MPIQLQSTLDISNSDISNSVEVEASIWIKIRFWFLSPTIIWFWRLFYKSKLPEVQIYLHFGYFELVKNSPINFEISRFGCIQLLMNFEPDIYFGLTALVMSKFYYSNLVLFKNMFLTHGLWLKTVYLHFFSFKQ